MADFFGVSQGRNSLLNIAGAVVAKAVAGRIQRVQVLVAGSGSGSVYDCATVAGAVAAVQVGLVPAVVGSYLLDMPCLVGLVVVPGPGQTLAISYD